MNGNRGDFRELSVDELDQVTGGSISLGPVSITVGELGIAFGFSINGVGGFAILQGGGVCGQLGNPKGGGIGGCLH
jgi:bacteriocin-like protein